MNASDLNSVGKRVRFCRQTRNLTLAGLAKRIDISANYISMIQRDDKNPSDKVLYKIADAVNVSYWWLKTGEEDEPAPPASTPEPSTPNVLPIDTIFPDAVTANIDVPLFLSLAIQSIPDMTKDKLAAKLEASPETIDKVLSGECHAASPEWRDYFPILARQMDLPNVRQKLHTLDSFLQDENTEKEKKLKMQLFELVKRYVGPEYKSFRFEPVQQNPSSVPRILYSEHIVFLKDEALICDNQDYGSSHFSFYRFADGADESLVASIMSSQLSYCAENHCDLTLVFDDDVIIDICKQNYKKQQGDHSKRLHPISLLLVDRKTWKPTGDIIHLNGDDQPGLSNT